MRFFILLYSFLFLLCASTAKAQTDSLRHILKNLNTDVADEELKQALQEVEALSADNRLHDSFYTKLLYVSDLLAKSTTDNQKVVGYNLAVTDILRRLLTENRRLDYASSLDFLAGSYQRIGQYQTALNLYFEALHIKEKILGEDHVKYAASLYNIGAIYLNTGQSDKALTFFQKELSIKRKNLGENNYDYVNCLINLCWSHNYMGHYDTALLFSQAVLVIIEKIPKENASEQTNSLMNIARLYHRMGQYDRALPLYEQALEIRKQTFGNGHFRYASALIDVGYFYHRIMGDYDKALQMYEEALVILEKIVEKKDGASNNILERLQIMYRLNLTHLGTVNYLMRRYDKALQMYEKALKLFPQSPDCMVNLANLYYGMGRNDSAISLCRQVSTFLENAGQNDLGYVYSFNNLASLFYSMGKYDDALPLFENYSRIVKETWGTKNLDYVNSLNSLGMTQSALANDTQAAFLFDKATNIALDYLSDIYATLSEQEKIAILKMQSHQFDFLPSFLFNQRKTRAILTNRLNENILALKGMVLEDQQNVLNSIRKSSDSSTLQFYYQWRSLRTFVGAQQLLPIANRVPYLDSLENITNQLEQNLSRHSLAFRNQQSNRAITTSDVAQKLLTGEAAIEFIRFQLYNKKWTDSILYAAIVLLPDDSIARFVPLCEEKQLQRLLRPYAGSTTGYAYIKRLYDSSIVPSVSKGKNLNDSLYQLIWKPLENHLKGVTTIHYAPAGLLHRIAFKALRHDASHLLIDKYQLNQVLSTRSVALRAEALQKPLLAGVWGNIDYDFDYAGAHSVKVPETNAPNKVGTSESFFNLYTNDTRGERSGGWTPLPDAKKEIDTISKTIAKSNISISVVSGGSATEEAFKALDGKSPQVLHMATHGFFLSVKESKTKTIESSIENSFTIQQNPMFRSGLVLAGGNHAWKGKSIPANREDGILTAYEIAQLDLSNTELLVLSACETGLGDLKHANEGVVGLQRAFKLAGVKTMVVSLWRVPDKETVELMTLFYNNWLGGLTIREALHHAQMEMKKKKYSAFYWASFVVVE